MEKTGPLHKLLKRRETVVFAAKKRIAEIDGQVEAYTRQIEVWKEERSRLQKELSDASEELALILAIADEDAPSSSRLRGEVSENTTEKEGDTESCPVADEEAIYLAPDALSQVKRVPLSLIDFHVGEERARSSTIAIRKATLSFLQGTRQAKTLDIVEELRRREIEVGGNSPVANLSALLSRTPFFRNENRRWLVDIEELRKYVDWSKVT